MTPEPAARGTLGPQSWDDLYDFLDPRRAERRGADRDASAAARCDEIRRKLVCFFGARGCAEAEDLAVETLMRVAAKCRGVDVSGHADRTGYFYGVARNVLHEWERQASSDVAGRESWRTEALRRAVPDAGAWAEQEAVHRCLAQCLAALTDRARRLILSYYREDRTARIAQHRALADEAGKTVNSLRIEVHRIRKAVRECLFERLRERTAAPRPT